MRTLLCEFISRGLHALFMGKIQSEIRLEARCLAYSAAIVLTLLIHDLSAQDRAEPLFTFGVIADVQYADRDNAGTRHYRSSPAKLAAAVGVFNQQKPDFVISLGDFINNDFHSYDTLNALAGRLRMPLYHVLGNHDFAGEKEKILSTLDLKAPYYSFVKKKWRFIILDGNDVSLYANKAGSEKHRQAARLYQKLQDEGAPNAYDWNGAVGEEQLEWLRRELAIARKKKEKVVVACHFPLYPDDVPELLWNAKEVRTLIESFPNVVAYFNGHVHVSQYFLQNHVHYVTFRGMVEEEENAFAIVSVFEDRLEDRLEIKGYGKEVSRVLE